MIPSLKIYVPHYTRIIPKLQDIFFKNSFSLIQVIFSVIHGHVIDSFIRLFLHFVRIAAILAPFIPSQSDKNPSIADILLQ